MLALVACGSAAKNAGPLRHVRLGAGLTATARAFPDHLSAWVARRRGRVPYRHVVSLSKTYRLAPSGALPAWTEIRVPLQRKVPVRMVVVAATASSAKGRWVPVPAHLVSGRRYATVRLKHFSWLRIFGIDVGEALTALKREVLDTLDAGFTAEARPPKCANEAKARTDGFSISSGSKDTVFWCFGVEDGHRVLRVVNHRRYPLAVTHPGLSVLSVGGFKLDLSHLSRLTSGKETIIFPADEVVFGVSLPPGSLGGIHTEFDAVGFSLYQLEVGVSTAASLLTRFGLGSPEKSVQKLADFLKIPQCAEALGASDLSIITKCFSPADIIKAYGFKGLLVAPLMIAGPVLNFFRSAANSAFDQINHRDTYQVIIKHVGAPSAPTTTEVATPTQQPQPPPATTPAAPPATDDVQRR